MKFSLDSYKAIIYYKVFPKQNAALVKKTEEQSSYQWRRSEWGLHCETHVCNPSTREAGKSEFRAILS